jgi:hypothetical protein
MGLMGVLIDSPEWMDGDNHLNTHGDDKKKQPESKLGM